MTGSEHGQAGVDAVETDIAGETHFQCETVQQTLTGEKLYTGPSVSYEETWAKVFISILDISNRKRMEEELEDYREHLEELVTARATELVALQHDLEQRVAERPEELAQVNVGLNTGVPIQNTGRQLLGNLSIFGETERKLVVEGLIVRRSNGPSKSTALPDNGNGKAFQTPPHCTAPARPH